MPITIPADLPAHDVLAREGVMVLSDMQAARQDIRPLRIGLLNLMPKKIQTETQFARLIGSTPLQIDFHLIRMSVHRARNTSAAHMEAFYRPFEEVRGEKAYGCFRHRNLDPTSPYLRGFSDDCIIPVSRWTEMRQAEIDAVPALRTLLGSPQVGPCLIEDAGHGALYLFNHLEYDSDTLRDEYERDLAAGIPARMPVNYFPDDDPTRPPLNRWRSHAHLLYGNWLNQIYQTTPYDISQIGR